MGKDLGKAGRAPRYLAFLRAQPCEACGRCPPCEPAHTYDGTQGKGIKSSDENAIPLCSTCHRTGAAAYHAIGERKFLAAWDINLSRSRARLRALFGCE